MNNIEIVNKALIFAAEAHKNQVRKLSTIPYILHPMEVSTIISTFTEDAEVIAAGLLHDTIEDCGITPEEMEKEFGKKIVDLVLSETENKYPDLPKPQSWRKRKEESIEKLASTNNINIKILWLADKLANIRSFCRAFRAEGPEFWNKLNQNDIKQQEWYYTSILNHVCELSNSDAYKEYKVRLDYLFGGKNLV